MKYDNPCCRGDYTFNAIDPKVLELQEHVQKLLPAGGGGRVEFLLALLLQPDMVEKRDWVFSLQYATMGTSDANVPVEYDPNVNYGATFALQAEDVREIRGKVKRIRQQRDKHERNQARMAKQKVM